MLDFNTLIISSVIVAMVLSGFAFLWKGIWSKKDDRALCAHLTVHYSEKRVSIDTAHHPYYIVNKNTRKAYAVPARVKPLVRLNIIEGMEHDGKADLERVLGKYGLDLGKDMSEEYPTDEELGIDVEAILRRHGLA